MPKKKPEPSAEETAAKELVRRAREQGMSLTGPDRLLKQFTKSVLEVLYTARAHPLDVSARWLAGLPAA